MVNDPPFRSIELLSFKEDPQDLSEQDVDAFVKDRGIPFPVAVSVPLFNAFDIGPIPDAILLDAAGKPVWRGHPGDLTAEIIEKHLP